MPTHKCNYERGNFKQELRNVKQEVFRRKIKKKKYSFLSEFTITNYSNLPFQTFPFNCRSIFPFTIHERLSIVTIIYIPNCFNKQPTNSVQNLFASFWLRCHYVKITYPPKYSNPSNYFPKNCPLPIFYHNKLSRARLQKLGSIENYTRRDRAALLNGD